MNHYQLAFERLNEFIYHLKQLKDDDNKIELLNLCQEKTHKLLSELIINPKE
jgi:hypothetical protein